MDEASRCLMRKTLAKICQLNENEAAISELLTNFVAIFESTIRTPGRFVYSAGESGSIAPGARSFTVTNEGTTDALLDGQVLSPGKFETYDADGQSDVLAGMSYDAQATTLVIHTVY